MSLWIRIFFQIKNDLDSESAKIDKNNGIYTAPVLYLNREKGNVETMTKEEIINSLLSDKKYINKTIDLIKKYEI